MKGLILAGGLGTRLRPLTFTGNKHMIAVANQPILFYGLKHLAAAGIRDVAVVLGPLHEGIQESVGDGKAFGLSIQYIKQGEPRGLAHAVSCARDFLGSEPFVMYLGDNLLQSGVGKFLEQYASDRPDAVVGAAPVAHPERYGVIEMSNGQILSISEKPAVPKSNLALIGVYLFTAAIHPIIDQLTPSRRGELEITDAIWKLWKADGRVSVLRVEGWWKDTGRPSDLLEANELVLRSLPSASFQRTGTVHPEARVEGSVGIGPGSVIESGVRLIGPTLLGANVHVSSGSTIGPDCAIGNDVNVSHASVRRSIVLERARIDGVAIGNSIVGRDVHIMAPEPSHPEVTLVVGDSSRIVLRECDDGTPCDPPDS